MMGFVLRAVVGVYRAAWLFATVCFGCYGDTRACIHVVSFMGLGSGPHTGTLVRAKIYAIWLRANGP